MKDGDVADGATQLPRVLGPTEALCVIVGSVIGSGIFIVPATVASRVPSILGIALVWVLGGLFSLAGALTLAELGAMLPRAGGPYVYLREAYGPMPAFLFGWTEFLVIRTGSTATLAAAFALNFAQLVPAPRGMRSELWRMAVAVAAMALLAAINVVGTRASGRVQAVGTALKVGALAGMIVLPFAIGKADPGRLTPVWPAAIDGHLLQGMMVAMVGVLWTFDGWIISASLAEEIHEPGRNIPWSLAWGMAILIAVYLGTTLVYHLVLPMGAVAASAARGSTTIVAAEFCRALLGAPGAVAIALVVMASTFIALNGNALAGPRAYFAMARDGLAPRWLGQIHPQFQTPAHAIVAQTAWSILLTVVGSALILSQPPGPESGLPAPIRDAWTKLNQTPLYDVLYTYAIFGATLFYTLTIASVFVLRARQPDLPRPYHTWGYPITPLLYTLASLFLAGSIVRNSRLESVAGLAIILLGLPAYYALSRPERVSRSATRRL